MQSDPDDLLHRLVVVALTIFAAASLLLAAFVARELWLQQHIVGLSNTLQTNLDELQETTEEIQSKMSELEITAEDGAGSQEWNEVDELLEDVDLQLESIEDNVAEVAMVSEETIDVAAAGSTSPAEIEPIRARASQVFTIFAVLIGVVAVAIAVLLGMAIRVQDDRLPA